MPYVSTLAPHDEELARRLVGFVPDEVFDIHAHAYHPEHFAPGAWSWEDAPVPFGCAEHRQALQRYLPTRTLHGLYFGLPHPSANHPAINHWVAEQVTAHGTELSRSLLLASPSDDREAVAQALRSGRFAGIKVYHCYADRERTVDATIEEYAPDWMWELLHETQGILMLHLVRDDALTDPANQQSLHRLCRTYSQAQVILAHVGRSFNYRHAREGLSAIAGIDNIVVDTSAITETEAFAAALRVLGPQRVLWGSDYAISETRGRCVTTGKGFFWLSPECLTAPADAALTLVGIESLLCLQEACEDAGLVTSDLEDIFRRNARRVLGL